MQRITDITTSARASGGMYIGRLLDTLAFTPQWTADTLQRLEKAKKEGDALVLHSEQDAVSDCRDLEKYLSHSWSKGKHARLFHPEAGNDFGVVEQFLKRYTP